MTQQTYIMFAPGKTPDGKGTYVEHPLQASDREEAKVQAMALVRVLELPEMHIVEEPGTKVFHSYPMRKSG